MSRPGREHNPLPLVAPSLRCVSSLLLATGSCCSTMKIFPPYIQLKAAAGKIECQNNMNSYKTLCMSCRKCSISLQNFLSAFSFPSSTWKWLLVSHSLLGLQKMYHHSLFTQFFLVCFPKKRQLAVLSLSVSCNCCLSQITFKQLCDFILIWQKWKKKKYLQESEISTDQGKNTGLE